MTGGAGFIGSHLVDRLAEQCAGVIALDNLQAGKTENLKSAAVHVEFIKADVRDREVVGEVMKRVDMRKGGLV